MGPLRRVSKQQSHRFNLLKELTSSIPAVTPVPFMSTRETLAMEVSSLGNVSRGVSFAYPLDCENVDTAQAVVIAGCKSQGGFHLTEQLHAPFSGKMSSHQRPLNPEWVSKPCQTGVLARGPSVSSSDTGGRKGMEPLLLGFYNRCFLVPKPNNR